MKYRYRIRWNFDYHQSDIAYLNDASIEKQTIYPVDQ